MSDRSPAGSASRRPALPLLWIALGAALAAATLGLGSPLHYALPAAALATAALLMVLRAPGLALAALPALLPPPQFAKVFAYEVALLLVAGLLLLEGLRTRARWTTRLDPIEALVVALFGWAIFTGLWVGDTWWYAFGIRKLAIGVIALWTARRLALRIRPETMRLGIVLGVIALAGATMLTATSEIRGSVWGFSRTEATNLGWGTSNFIAALLVAMLPTALLVAVHAPSRMARLLGWVSLPLAGLVMATAASRGGAMLTLLLVLMFFGWERFNRRTAALFVAALAAVTLLIVGPGADRLLERFTDQKELGSMVIRLMYFREGWHRFVEYLPFGMGQGQGYVTIDRLASEDPHNYWLVVGPELGLPGLALWIAVLVLLWKRGMRLARSPHTQVMGRALILTLVVSQLNSMFEPTFQGLQYHFLFYWIVGAHLGGAEAVERGRFPAQLDRQRLPRAAPAA